MNTGEFYKLGYFSTLTKPTRTKYAYNAGKYKAQNYSFLKNLLFPKLDILGD